MGKKEQLKQKETIQIYRITQNSVKEKTDEVAVEYTVSIALRDGRKVTAVCTPEYIEEFVLGRRYVLGDMTQEEVEQLREAGRAKAEERAAEGRKARTREVRTSEEEQAGAEQAGAEQAGAEQAGAEQADTGKTGAGQTEMRPTAPLTEVSVQEIFHIIETYFEQPGPLFTSTGCAHSCALVYAGKAVCFIEDIGRHNALDKVIGFALKRGIPLTSSYIISSGRISGDYLQKVIAAGIPLAVSRAAVTSGAVALAKQHNITMLGFMRKQAGNLYHEGTVAVRTQEKSPEESAGAHMKAKNISEERYSLLLLAGGKSSRMGTNKAQLLHNGRTFVDNLLEKAAKLGITQIFLSGLASEREGVQSVSDIYPERGPLGGLHACMSVMKTPYCLVLPVDVPQIPVKVLETLLEQHEQKIAGTPEDRFPFLLQHGERKEHLIGIYPVQTRDFIEELIREHSASVKYMLREWGCRCLQMDLPKWQAENINTPEAYEQLLFLTEEQSKTEQ